MDETTIPLLPCVSLDESLGFYRTLGFEVTYEQTVPYVYGAVRRGGLELHFSRVKGLDPQKAFSSCLVMVREVTGYHQPFADALRAKYGRVPTAGIPRIMRLRPGQSRFTLIDPAGNALIFINREEPEGDDWHLEHSGQSPLAYALDSAANLRDWQWKDAAAAKVLDVALARNPTAAPLDRARALAARAELAVAMGDSERAQTLRT